MAPSAQVQRAQAAVKAMKLIGFDPALAKTVLKKLLKVYENNWEYIEAENYRLLADSILDDQESVDPKVNGTDVTTTASRLSRKRLRNCQEDAGPLPSTMESVASSEKNFRGKRLDLEAPCSNEGEGIPSSPHLLLKDGATEGIAPQHYLNFKEANLTQGHISPQVTRFNNNVLHLEKGKSVSPSMHDRDKHQQTCRSGTSTCYKVPKIEPNTKIIGEINAVGFPLIPEVEADVSDSIYSVAVFPSHGILSETTANEDKTHEVDIHCAGANVLEGPNIWNGVETPEVSAQKGMISEFSSRQEILSTSTNIASSSMGEVKLSLTYSSVRPDFKVPSLESIFKIVEDRCLKSYKILQPDFSLMNLLKEICHCAVDLASESSKDTPEKSKVITLSGTHSPMMKSPMMKSPMMKSPMMKSPMMKSPMMKSPILHHRMTRRSFASSHDLVAVQVPREALNIYEPGLNVNCESNGLQDNSAPETSMHNASQSLALIPLLEHPLTIIGPLLDEIDIAKGEERVRISLINEFTSEKFPPYFHYIPRNAVYQNAHVNFSLARIGDEDCCPNCYGDCLTAPLPCACTGETGGEFVYTLDGLLKREFLDECISMNRYPDKHHHVYCKDCPIEKSKNEHKPDACKGHLVRKFIKECWSKCGCSKHCGNRVVQRGIARNLQVFFSDDSKGWGLRTLEELPRGAFICEYIGEILTNIELYDRTIQQTGGARHTYPVLLDADWGSEAGLRDEEALCLDATFYGNVGRFVNHRCFDANMVEIPVEWETPDHHYYHLAFFTTRKVEMLEELTWDYGIDFEDHSHPIKAFKCLCGSKFCRDRSRSRGRPRSRALVSK